MSEDTRLVDLRPRVRDRDDGVLSRRVGEETVLYDTERSRAVCLDPSASEVWRRCDGSEPLDDIVDCVGEALKVDNEASADIVRYALGRFRRHGLLVDDTQVPETRPSRREVLARLRDLGVAAALPAVVALAAPQPADAQSGPVVCGQSCHQSIGIFCPPGCVCSKPTGNGVCLTA